MSVSPREIHPIDSMEAGRVFEAGRDWLWTFTTQKREI